MDTWAPIISDWLILLVGSGWATVVAIGLWWIVSTERQRNDAGVMISAAKRALLRAMYWFTGILAPLLFAASLIVTPWPPSRFSVFLIVASGLLMLFRLFIGLIFRSLRFSIDAHNDFMAWHRMHFAFLHEILQSGVLTDEQAVRLRKHIDRISERYESKSAPDSPDLPRNPR
jgi:hypothetical protein